MEPHSIAIWLRWEIHGHNISGQLSGSPKDHKEYRVAIRCDSMDDAKLTIDKIVQKFKEELDHARE